MTDAASVHPADRAVWAEIDRGVRKIDWAAWFGHPDGADYLTAQGHAITARAVAFFEDFFGPRWLPAAMRSQKKDGSGPPVPALGRFSPVFEICNGHHAGRWAEAIRWWATLQLLAKLEVPGLAEVRRNTRRDVTLAKTLHTLTQTRLAALGIHRGAAAILEPDKTAGPGDVLLEAGQTTVFIEVVTVTEDQHFTDHMRERHRHREHLWTLQSQYNVHWQGDMPGPLSPGERAAWLRETADAAARCAQDQRKVEVPLPRGGVLTARPGSPPIGTTLTGPLIERDQAQLLKGKVQSKAAQSQGAGTAWLWVEDHGALTHTPFTRLPLAHKIRELADLFRSIFDEYPHVAGIVYSNASRRRLPLPDPQTEDMTEGIGLIRGVPLDRVRETIILHPMLVRADQTSLMTRLCAEEPSWFDWALQQEQVPMGLASLLIQPQRRLWTP